MKKQGSKINSEQRIIDSFAELIYKKGFSNINVTDIAREAEVSRGTFYTHFKSKEELLMLVEKQLLNDLQQDLTSACPKSIEWIVEGKLNQNLAKSMILEILTNFEKHKKLIRALVSENGDPNFMGQVKEIIYYVLARTLAKFKNKIEVADGIPEDYARAFVVGEIFSLVSYWINKPNAEPAEMAADIIVNVQNIAPMKVFKSKMREAEVNE